MEATWSVVLVAFGLLAWAGQIVAWFAPAAAAKVGLVEKPGSVEPVYWADIRGEAVWDCLTLWTLPAAGVLLWLDHAAWPTVGLIGGSVYAYFAGRGILTRLAMRRSGFRIGDPANVRLGLIMLAVWGVIGVITIVAAAVTIASV